MSREASLTLKDSHVSVEIEENGIHTSKSIGYDALSTIFEKQGDFSSPFFPGTYGLQKYAVSNNREYYLYIEQPRVVTCKYQVGSLSEDDYYIDEDDYSDSDAYEEARDAARERYEEDRNSDSQVNKFTCPILAWFIVLDKSSSGSYSVRDTFMYALKTPIYTGKEPLYKAPFSNVYGDGRVCWGENIIEIPQLKSIQGLSTLFFGAYGNTDLDENRFQSFGRKYFSGEAHLSLHLQMEVDSMLKDSANTPDDVLEFVNSKLSQESTTVEDKFNSIMNRY